jgi:hypothetical protein
MSNYNLTTSKNAGSMTLQDLLPGVDMDQYDWDSFDDVIPEFSTALLDITKQQGRQDVSNTISGSQEGFMNVPSATTAAGAGGFGGAGGGGRGLIGYGQAQEGMFSDVFGAMQGAEKANITQLESLKDKAFSFFSNIQGDLGANNTTSYDERIDENESLYGEGPGVAESGLWGPPGSPGHGGTSTGAMDKGPDGQTYRWNGSQWEIVDSEYLAGNLGTGPSGGGGDSTVGRTGP